MSGHRRFGFEKASIALTNTRTARLGSITLQAFMLTARSSFKIERASCCVLMVMKHCRACSSEIVLSVSNSVVALQRIPIQARLHVIKDTIEKY